jgi:hypothetical protein
MKKFEVAVIFSWNARKSLIVASTNDGRNYDERSISGQDLPMFDDLT